jgi:outer membrane assembly lipoprotein YfiO
MARPSADSWISGSVAPRPLQTLARRRDRALLAPMWRRVLAGLTWRQAVLALLPVLCAACATKLVPVAVLPEDEEYRLGMEAYERQDYGRAVEHLNRLVLNYPESEHTVRARYFLGQANFRLEEYPSAAQDFERFQRDFPTDSLADDALYWAGRSYEEQSLKPQLDQADTRRAISSYSDLTRQYPDSPLAGEAQERSSVLRERLAQKEFLNAQYYFKQKHWKATEIYVRSLIEEFPQSSFVAPAYLILYRSYEAQGKDEDAGRIRETLMEQFPDSPEASQLRQTLTSSPEAAAAGGDQRAR